MSRVLIAIFLSIFLVTIVSALGYDNPYIPRLTAPTTTITTTNGTCTCTANVTSNFTGTDYILKNGSTTTTATIPFAVGADFSAQYQDGPSITFGDSLTGFGSSGAADLFAMINGVQAFDILPNDFEIDFNTRFFRDIYILNTTTANMHKINMEVNATYALCFYENGLSPLLCFSTLDDAKKSIFYEEISELKNITVEKSVNVKEKMMLLGDAKICNQTACFTMEELNKTGGGGNATWNESYANGLYISSGNLTIYNGLINNASYLSTYNVTYDGTTSAWNGNSTALLGLINNASYLSTYNSTYNNLLNQNCGSGLVANGTLSNGTLICTTVTSMDYTNLALLNQSQTFIGNQNINGTLNVNSSVGFCGTLSTTSAGISCGYSNPTGSVIRGANIYAMSTRNTGTVAQIYGNYFGAYYQPTLGSTANRQATSVYGGYGLVQTILDINEPKNFTMLNGYGYVDNLILQGATNSTGWVKSTNSFGFMANIPSLTGNVSVTNRYAFYDAGQNVSGITNAYGLYSLSPNNYLAGSLTVNENLSGRIPYWSGYDNSTQGFLNTSNAQVLNISNNNDIIKYGINAVGNQNLTFDSSGVYVCSLSPEFFQSSGTNKIITFWLQKNGTDVAWSNSRYTISNGNYFAPTIEYVFEIRNPTTENIRFMWYSDSTNTQVISVSGLTSPTRPSIPGVLLNCKKNSGLTN